jgi:hypothetical protein
LFVIVDCWSAELSNSHCYSNEQSKGFGGMGVQVGKKFDWRNITWIVAGFSLGFLVGVFVSFHSSSTDHSLWEGKGVEWMSASAAWVGVIVTGLAIYFAVSSGRRATDTARELQQDALFENRRTLKAKELVERTKALDRYRIIATAYRDEFPAVIVKSVELSLMLQNPLLSDYLPKVFKYAATHPTPVLDRFGFDPEALGKDDGLKFVLAAVKVNRLRDYGKMNMAVAHEWIPETQRLAAEQMLIHLDAAREAVESAYIRACELAGGDQGFPIGRLHQEGERSHQARVGLHTFSEAAGVGDKDDDPDGWLVL